MNKSTQYLYDIEPEVISELQRPLAQMKIDATKRLIDKLYEEPMATRDDERIDAAFGAQKFNRKLLEELKC